jgi:hypothetical protein
MRRNKARDLYKYNTLLYFNLVHVFHYRDFPDTSYICVCSYDNGGQEINCRKVLIFKKLADKIGQKLNGGIV